MNGLPFAYDLQAPGYLPSHYDHHIQRRLSSMTGMFADQVAYTAMLSEEDRLLYEVYEIRRPGLPGELPHGVSIVHPGKVGNEFYMTKGHFHAVLETAEIYYCLQGEGCMVMENPQGDWAVEWLTPGRLLYIPPRWAHRSVNTVKAVDLMTFYIYPGHAGHDYGTIERQGFRKLIVDTPSGPQIIDNPRWRPTGEQE